MRKAAPKEYFQGNPVLCDEIGQDSERAARAGAETELVSESVSAPASRSLVSVHGMWLSSADAGTRGTSMFGDFLPVIVRFGRSGRSRKSTFALRCSWCL